jgi:hypothetical protein
MNDELLEKLPIKKSAIDSEGREIKISYKWRPIKNGTYNIYITSFAKQFGVRFWSQRGSGHLGEYNYWGFTVEIGFWWTLNIWINFNIYKRCRVWTTEYYKDLGQNSMDNMGKN